MSLYVSKGFYGTKSLFYQKLNFFKKIIGRLNKRFFLSLECHLYLEEVTPLGNMKLGRNFEIVQETKLALWGDGGPRGFERIPVFGW